jgi:hypothetical protein
MTSGRKKWCAKALEDRVQLVRVRVVRKVPTVPRARAVRRVLAAQEPLLQAFSMP